MTDASKSFANKIYVTGYVKTDPNRTRTEIHLTLKLHSSTTQTYVPNIRLKMAKSAFTEGLLPTL